MLLNGISLTIIGMAVVFIFLTLMVIVMNLLDAFLRKFMPKSLEEPAVVQKGNGAEIAVAIAAARAYTAK